MEQELGKTLKQMEGHKGRLKLKLHNSDWDLNPLSFN